MIRIDRTSVVVRRSTLEAKYPGGVARYEADAPYAAFQEDGQLTIVSFPSTAGAELWVERIAGQGIHDLALVATEGAIRGSDWLEAARGEGHTDVWLRGSVRADSPAAANYETLSRSDSGLLYVRERKNGFVRVLTEGELAELADAPPCPQCNEQLGCEHVNLAGEPLLSDEDIESLVPLQWRDFARACGVSRNDLERLRAVEQHEGEFRLSGGRDADMRLRELVLLLNGE